MGFTIPTDWRIWVKGIIAAFIGGAAGAFSSAIAVPDVFTMTKVGMIRILKVSIVSGAIALAGYLKQSPMPGGTANINLQQNVNVTAPTQAIADAVAKEAASQAMNPPGKK